MNKYSAEERHCSDSIISINQEILLLNNAFNEIGDKNNVEKIGKSFTEVLLKYDDINLYSDGSHPSKYGSYLIALNFFKSLTNENPKTLNYNAELDETKVEILKGIVSKMKN